MSTWAERIKEKEGRTGLIPWLSVGIQKWLLVAVVLFFGVVETVVAFTDKQWLLAFIFAALGVSALYALLSTRWLSNTRKASKPARVAGYVGLVAGLVLALAFILGTLFFLLLIWFIGFIVSLFGKVSDEDKYVIKKEEGKEVVKEKLPLGFEREVGELHENWDGTKETRAMFEPHVKVDKPGMFSDERKAEIEGQKGVFKRRLFEKQPTFHPDEEAAEEEED